MDGFWNQAGVEPSLNQLLADPIMGILMRYDGIDETEVRQIISDVQGTLTGAAEGARQMRRTGTAGG